MWKAKLYAIYEVTCFPSPYSTYLQQCNSSELDRNLIFYSFSRLNAIVADTTAHIYAKEEQILAIRMIVLEE